MTRVRLTTAVAIAAVLLFFAGPSIVSYVTDYWWYQETGFQAVYLALIGAQARLPGKPAIGFGWRTVA